MKRISLFLCVVLLLNMVVLIPAIAEGTHDFTFAWWGNQVRNERTIEVIDMYEAENPGVTFDPQFFAWSDYWNKLATAAAGHSLPDVLQMDYSYILQYVNNGLLVDLTPYIEDGTLDVSNIPEELLESGRVGDGFYGVINGMAIPGILYNKTLLDEYGIEMPMNMTMDEFLDKCSEVYEKTGYKSNLGVGSDGYLSTIARGLDGYLYKDGEFALTREAALAFFSMYERGYNEGWHLGSEVFAETTLSALETDPLVYGNSPDVMSWFGFNGPGQWRAMQAAAPEGVELSVATAPSANLRLSNTIKPSQFWCISSDCEDPAEAVKFIDWLTNSVDCNNVLMAERGLPPSTEVLEAIKPAMGDIEQATIEYYNDYVMNNMSPCPEPDAEGASEVRSLVVDLLEQILYGACTAEEAADTLMEQGPVIIGNHKN